MPTVINKPIDESGHCHKSSAGLGPRAEQFMLHCPQVGSKPSGMVLVFTLVIMMLIAMMGAAVLMNSRTELTISANTSIGRDAFSRADSAARIATLLTRVLINPVLGNFDQLQPRNDSDQYKSVMFVEKMPKFDLHTIQSESTKLYDYRRRYIRAGSWEGRGDVDQAAQNNDGSVLYYEPHLIFKVKDGDQEKVVATSAVSLDFGDPVQAGRTLDQDRYSTGGGNIVMHILVSVNGRAPGRELGGEAKSAFDSQESKVDEPHSVVTIIFREMV